MKKRAKAHGYGLRKKMLASGAFESGKYSTKRHPNKKKQASRRKCRGTCKGEN